MLLCCPEALGQDFWGNPGSTTKGKVQSGILPMNTIWGFILVTWTPKPEFCLLRVWMESGKLGCLTWWIPPQLLRKLYHLHSAKMMNFMPRKWIAAASFRLIGHTHISLSHIPTLNFSGLVFLSSFSTPPKALSPCLHTSAVLLSILKTRNAKFPAPNPA